MVTLTKPDGGSLGFSVVGKTVGSLVSICVKGLNKGGVAEKNGFINVGDRIVKVCFIHRAGGHSPFAI